MPNSSHNGEKIYRSCGSYQYDWYDDSGFYLYPFRLFGRDLFGRCGSGLYVAQFLSRSGTVPSSNGTS